MAKAYRPISLLPTLGKIVEAVMARRLSYWAETHHMLPDSQFGARPRRSCQQALTLLVEEIMAAWKNNKVVSMVSFDVKGAYNGVVKEVLLNRLRLKGVPQRMIKWVESFCSKRKAAIVVNGEEQEMEDIKDPGLPQGSAVSPILYIFYNSDLFTGQTSDRGGNIGFVDDFTRWVTGDSIDANMHRLNSRVVPRALQWAKDSGAIFEGDKTTLIHFTRNTRKRVQPEQALQVAGSMVAPVQSQRVLGVILDSRLNFREHMASVKTRGLKSVLQLKRLKGLSPKASRQLLKATVFSRTDYAPAVWYALQLGKAGQNSMSNALGTIQRHGAHAVTKCFKTVAQDVASWEAGLDTIHQRLSKKISSFWVDIFTVPNDNPLWRCVRRAAIGIASAIKFTTPLQKMQKEFNIVEWRDRLDTIKAWTTPPWGLIEGMVEVHNQDRARAARSCIDRQRCEIQAFTDGSVNNGFTGRGVVLVLPSGSMSILRETAVASKGACIDLVELRAIYDAIVMAIQLPHCERGQDITIYTDSIAAIRAIQGRRQHEGSKVVEAIHRGLGILQRVNYNPRVRWIPRQWETQLGDEWGGCSAVKIQGTTAKHVRNAHADILARFATRVGAHITDTGEGCHGSRRSIRRMVAENIMATPRATFSTPLSRMRQMDSALPGKHVLMLYNNLQKHEAQALAQLRTGHCGLNAFLTKINKKDNSQCDCGEGEETVHHFLLRCPKHNRHRAVLAEQLKQSYGNLSHMVGGRQLYERDGVNPDGDTKTWKPDMSTVRAVIKFTIDTGRWEYRGRIDKEGIDTDNEVSQENVEEGAGNTL